MKCCIDYFTCHALCLPKYFFSRSDCFTKAEQLRQRHEQLLAHRTESTSEHMTEADLHSSTEEEDEEDFDEFLNWRAKIS